MRRSTHPWRIGIPMVSWPHDDRLTFEAALRPSDLWEDAGRGQHWRPDTRHRYRMAWGRYLRFLQATERLEAAGRMDSRLRPEYLEAYHAFMMTIGLTARSICGEIESLHNTNYNLFPGAPLDWLKALLARLKSSAQIQHRGEPTLVRIDHLLDAAMAAMRVADRGESSRQVTGGVEASLASSLDFRDALMVAVLSVTLLRRRNFASLALGSTLLRQEGCYLVRLPRDQVKNGKPIEFEVYPRLVPFIDRYLDHHRPQLLQGRHSDRLWCNAYGADLRPNRVNEMIKRFTLARFGVALSPHRFRTCAASSLAELAPELVRIIQALLAHWGPATAERYYNKVQMIAASRRHASAMETLRIELKRNLVA